MYTYHFDWKVPQMLYLQFSCPIFPIWYWVSVALFVAQMPNMLHFCASYLCTIEVEIGFLGIRCVQWQDLDVMTRCSNKVFQLQAWGNGKWWTQIIPISCRAQIWAYVSYLHILRIRLCDQQDILLAQKEIFKKLFYMSLHLLFHKEET